MKIEFLPLISFVIATTFSPGPNNITSASMGIVYGYRKTLTFLLGISSGFFLVMVVCAYLSSALLTLIPSLQTYLKWVGSLYILYLAFGVLKSSQSFEPDNDPPKAFMKGFILQLSNPKVIVYGLTLFSTFLAAYSNQSYILAGFSLGFALTAFTATSTWAICGAVIKNKLKNENIRKSINWGLAVLLVYTAIDLSGIMDVL